MASVTWARRTGVLPDALLSRSIAPDTVAARDIMEFDPDGEPIDAGVRRLYLKRYMHNETYDTVLARLGAWKRRLKR